MCTKHTQQLRPNTNSTPQSKPGEVAGLSATSISINSISIAWNSGSAAGYKLSYVQGNVPPADCIANNVVSTANNTITVNDLLSDSLYGFRVCAMNSDGDLSLGETVIGQTLQPSPTNVSNLLLTSTSTTQINLSWIAGVYNAGYKITYQAGGVAPTTCSIGTDVSFEQISTNGATVTGLNTGSQYSFRVCAVNANANPDISSGTTVSGTTNAYPAAPSAPTGVYLSLPYYKGIQLHFNTVAGATSYKAYYKTSAGVSTSDTVVNGISSGYIIENLNPYGTYYVKVVAVDAYAQTSALSAEVSITMPEFVKIPQNLSTYSAIASNYVRKIYATGTNIYALSGGIGLSVSTNAGDTWLTDTNFNGLGTTVRNVFAEGNNIYVSSLDGLFISTNNGATWINKTTNDGLADNAVFDVFATGNNIYVANGGSISISTNGGLTWVNTGGILYDYDSDRSLSVAGSNIYLTGCGLFSSTNAGATWNTVSGIDTGNCDYSVYAIANNVYVAGPAGLFISTNKGVDWITKTAADGLASTTAYDVYVENSNIYVGTNAGLSLSTNAGTTWVNKTTANGLPINIVRQVRAVGNNIYATCNNSGGLSVSTDGGTTFTNKTSTNGILTDNIKKVFSINSNIYLATQRGLFVSTNNGVTWVYNTNNGLDEEVVINIYANGNNLYAATASGLFISTDNGATWLTRTMANGLGGLLISDTFVDGSNIYAATNGGLSISTDSGATWVNKNQTDGLGNDFVKSVYVFGSNIYAATLGGLSVSTNNGNTWTNKTTVDGLGNNEVYAAYVSNNTVYAATNGGGLAISYNGGATFSNKTTLNGLGSNSLFDVYVSGNNIYVATLGGLSISTNNGVTWINKTTANKLGSNAVNGIFIADAVIYAATYTGLYTSTILAQPPPPNVAALTATAASGTVINLAWTSGGGSTAGYQVSYASGATSPATCALGTVVPSGQINFTNEAAGSSAVVSIIGLTANTQYSFRVCAVNGNVTSDVSSGITASATTLQALPPNVTSLAATATSDTILSLNWTSGGGSTASYEVSYATGASSPATCAAGTVLPQGQISGTTASITTLTADTQYSFRVCAVNSNTAPDISSGTIISATTLQAAPPNVNTLIAVPTSDTIIGLTWGSGGGTTAGYAVSYASGATPPATCAAGTVLSQTQISGASATITGLSGNTQYSFLVCAINGNATPYVSSGTSTAMTTLQAPPPNVTALVVSASSSSSISLGWTSGGGTTVGYRVSYVSGAIAPATCAAGTVLPQGQISGTTASITGLSADTQYSFRVCAINANQTPYISSGIVTSGTTLQAAPPNVTGLLSVPTSDTIIGLTWTTGGGTTAGFVVSYASGATPPATCAAGTILPQAQISGTTATVTGLTAVTEYSFRVCAINGNTTPDLSSGTTTTNTTLQTGAPNVTGLGATIGSDTSLSLSWTSGGGTTAGYRVSYASGATAPATCALGTVLPQGQISGVTASITGLTADTQYSFRVCAINGDATPYVSSGTTTSVITIKAAPGNLSATGGVNLVTLSWSTVTGGTSYAIYYSTAPGVTKGDTRVVVAAPSYQLTALAVNTTYYFNIAVIVGTTESDLPASETSATTYPAPPGAPTGVYLSWPYSKGMQFHFNTVAGATSYKAYYKTSPGVSIGDTVVNGVTNGYTITNLNSLGTYYVKIKAIDAYNQESLLSAEASLAMPEFVKIPQNLASYTSIASNYVYGIYASGNNVYAGSSDAGLSISTNGGNTWATKTNVNGLGSNTVNNVFVEGNKVYVAIGNGLSISTDNGATWINKTVADGFGGSYAYDVYATGANIYAATTDGISISTDSGATWANKTVASDGIIEDDGSKSVVVVGNNIYLVGCGMSVSTDAGATWTTASAININLCALDVYASGNNVYVSSVDGGGLRVSTNNGIDWVSKTSADGLGDDATYGVYANGNNIYVPTCTTGLSISTNAGATWAVKTSAHGLPSSCLNQVYADGNNIYVVSNYGGGLSISTDGGTTWANKTSTNVLVNGISGIYASNDSLYASTSSGLFISPNNGATWIKKSVADGLAIDAVKNTYASVSGNNIYAATESGLSISTNSGNTWLTKQIGGSDWDITDVSVSPNGSNIYASGWAIGITISTDSGATWRDITGFGSDFLFSIHAYGNNIYVSNWGSGIFISTDNGSSWVNKTTLDGLIDNNIFQTYGNGVNVYVASMGGLSISTDNGTTWLNKTTADGLGSNMVRRIYVAGNNVYAATDAGLSISTDAGSTWLNKTRANGLVDDQIVGVSVVGTTVYVINNSGLYASGL